MNSKQSIEGYTLGKWDESNYQDAPFAYRNFNDGVKSTAAKEYWFAIFKAQEQKPVEEDATVKMLDDIISWEKDLSEYHSLEGILRERYKITKR